MIRVQPMRCFRGYQLGSLEHFGFEDVPVPSPGPGQVLIRHKAVAIGFVDGLIIEGKYQLTPELPYIPGGEIAGVVEAVGEGVKADLVGSRVVTWQLGGGFAEFSVAAASDVDLIPDNLDDVSAAALLVDYQTARYALLERGQLKPGETIVVAGAAGGVGSAAIQIARRQGARVVAAVSSPQKAERAKELGADLIVLSNPATIRNELKGILEGIDAVLDPVGGALSEQLFRSLAKEGRHLVVGFAAGSIPSIKLNLALLKSASIIGVDLRHFYAAHPAAARSSRCELLEDVSSGVLVRPRTMTYGFRDGRDALRGAGNRGRVGKPTVVF